MSRRIRFFIVLGFIGGMALPALAQTEFKLAVHKQMGYGSGSQIQGTFRAEASGPAHLVSVTFKIDETVIETVNAAPFTSKFDTDNYAPGWHTLTAEGKLADGRQLTDSKRFEFLTTAQAQKSLQEIMFPILGIVGLLIAVGMGSQLLLLRRPHTTTLPLGAPRQYGMVGGTICPKCQRPFSLHWWAFNVGIFSKFDRCEYCGKWSVVRRESREKLAEAEAAELQLAQPDKPIAEASAEEKLARQLDESRYMD